MQTTFGYRRGRASFRISRVQEPRQSSLIPRYRAAVFQIKGSAAALLALSALAMGACGGGPGLGGPGGGASETDSFTLTGPLKADPGGRGAGGGCEWTPAVFDLKFTSAAMSGGVQVKFDTTLAVGGVGDFSATQPVAADGSTPLRLVVAGKAIPASDGTIHVTDADLTARKWKGSIEAAFSDGTRLTGTWSCQAP